MKKVALCIHDLRVSDREKIVETIKMSGNALKEFRLNGIINTRQNF